jgi:hypothetical protein
VPPILERGFAGHPSFRTPYRHMRDARADFVIAAGASVGLDCAPRRYRSHLVVESVGTRLDAALQGQWR